MISIFFSPRSTLVVRSKDGSPGRRQNGCTSPAAMFSSLLLILGGDLLALAGIRKEEAKLQDNRTRRVRNANMVTMAKAFVVHLMRSCRRRNRIWPASYRNNVTTRNQAMLLRTATASNKASVVDRLLHQIRGSYTMDTVLNYEHLNVAIIAARPSSSSRVTVHSSAAGCPRGALID
jgi:hypothetical protein